jgi:riboflavin kinase
MDETLLLIKLAKEGAIGGEKAFPLRYLADELGVSPQTVLRVLERLEKKGLIRRGIRGRKTHVELTEEALKFLEDLYDELGKALYSGTVVGEVVSGLGEGAYYVQRYRGRIREYLGFDPYPGTLNVRVIFPKTIFDALCNVRPIIIPGFVKEGRTFGDVRAYRVKINGIEGAIVIPSRTVHPPKIAEIVAPVKVREKLSLRDGDRIKIKVIPEG